MERTITLLPTVWHSFEIMDAGRNSEEGKTDKIQNNQVQV